ncbi:MAG: cold shock domain-containing protein [Prolixibacteraceae bacterium]
MGRSQESFQKKEVRNKKEKKRKEKEKKRQARKEDSDKGNSLDDMIAYVDENGNIVNSPPDPNKKTEVKLEDIEIGVPKGEEREDMNPIRTGTVTFFNDEKGYGFIKDSETKEDIFVHINNTEDEITKGNLVKFEVEMGPKGPIAVNVKQLK